MKSYCITLDPSIPSEDFLHFLEGQYQINPILISEEGELDKIYCTSSQFPELSIEGITIEALNNFNEVNWEEQCKEHCSNFHEGKLLIEVGKYGNFSLKPGPGFGDLSHPTSQLCLKLLLQTSPKRSVIDIGSGSGILSFAAAIMGHFPVIAVEIDPAAMEHAKNNSKEIDFPYKAPQFLYPHELENTQSDLILINMTQKEQKAVWTSHKALFKNSKEIISSGILIEQKEEYHSFCQTQGWKASSIHQKEKWMAFTLCQR